MGHSQPPTTVCTNNLTASGFVNNNIQMKRSKSWEMNFPWLRDKHMLKELRIIWDKGIDNLADYFTKRHATVHHSKMKPQCIADIINILFLQIYIILKESMITFFQSQVYKGVLIQPRSRH